MKTSARGTAQPVAVQGSSEGGMSSVSRYASNSRYSARGEGLQAVPADVEVIADTLRSLDLSANELQALLLPASLPVLDELLLADNLLDAPTLQRLRPALPATLRILDLTANRLVAFPPMLLRLPQLTVLRIARQQLRALPSALSALASLEEFDASYNSLGAALQLDAPGLPRLRRLLLNGNCLTTVRCGEGQGAGGKGQGGRRRASNCIHQLHGV